MLILKEDLGHGVVRLTLNRPDRLNALSQDLMTELTAELVTLDLNHDVRVVILHGAGRAFAAGADLKAMAQWTVESTATDKPLEVWDKLAHFSKPVIVAVHGLAYGGGLEIALMGDILLASSNAKFALPEVKLGVIPGAGGTQRLSRLIGKTRAMAHILTGEPFDADKALAWGVVAEVLPDDETLLARATEIAQQIASYGPLAIRAAKQAILTSQEQPLTEGLATERQQFYGLFATADQTEGMAAFLEKRAPVFTGK